MQIKTALTNNEMRKIGGGEKVMEDFPPIEASKNTKSNCGWVSAIGDAEIQEFGVPLELNIHTHGLKYSSGLLPLLNIKMMRHCNQRKLLLIFH